MNYFLNPSRLRRTKILATLGPSSSTEEVITRLFEAGANVFRLNFSHGSYKDHAERHAIIRKLEKKTGCPIGILVDLQGPKLRIGNFIEGKVTLKKGQAFCLDQNPDLGNTHRVNLPHPEIIQAVTVGSSLLLDDGKMKLKIREVGHNFLVTEVVVAGVLSNNKGVNVPDVLLPIPALTKKDRSDLDFALKLGVDYVALSFVQRPEDIQEAKELVGKHAWIMAKLEKPQALDNLEEIMKISDAVMIARGDLGVELPPEMVPLVQKRILKAAQAMGRPVVVATQMLESMITAPTPTRAEASDVATAVFEGADAVMLSAESAAGQYPVEAVDIMGRIIMQVEHDESWQKIKEQNRQAPEATMSDAMAAGVQAIADTVNSRIVAAYTESGLTTLRIARARPDCFILGIACNHEMARRLSLVWGITSEPMHDKGSTLDKVVQQALSIVRRMRLADLGDTVIVVTCGSGGRTNTIHVASVG